MTKTEETPKTKVKTLYDQFETNREAETEKGVVLDYGAAGKIRIHRAGGGNQKFKNYTSAKLKPYTRQISAGTMDEEVSRKLTADIYARTVIVGWEGVLDRSGNVLEFNYDNVVKILMDLPDLFEDIQRAAQDAANFRADIQEEVAGN